MNIPSEIYYFFGVITGAIIMRYGFGLGVKSVQKIKNDLPLTGDNIEPIEQEFTGEE